MADVNQIFAFHKLNEDGMKRAILIARVFQVLLDELEPHCPSGREWSIVKTKLEEAAFFAKKAMAMDPANQLKE